VLKSLKYQFSESQKLNTST